MRSKNLSLISVIVPTYNEDKYIEECLVSIKQQSYSNVELIVVDDGSTDDTMRIAKKYADVLLEQEHQGPGVARNKGAKVAKGKILIFIDADMYLDKNYVEKIIKPIVEGKAVATFTKEEYVANPENIWSKCFQIDNSLLQDKRIPNDYPDKDIKFRAIKRSTFIKSGGYHSGRGYGEDEVFKKNKSFAALGAKCFHYNPDTLKDVFLSARWIGRSKDKNELLRYSLFNSLRIAIKKINQGAPLSFLFYKLFFDYGIKVGIFYKNIKGNYSK